MKLGTGATAETQDLVEKMTLEALDMALEKKPADLKKELMRMHLTCRGKQSESILQLKGGNLRDGR